jgi:hypothetical protein
MKVITTITQKVDSEHYIVTYLADLDVRENHIVHTLEEAKQLVGEILDKMQEEPTPPAGEPRTKDEWDKYLENLNKKEH